MKMNDARSDPFYSAANAAWFPLSSHAFEASGKYRVRWLGPSKRGGPAAALHYSTARSIPLAGPSLNSLLLKAIRRNHEPLMAESGKPSVQVSATVEQILQDVPLHSPHSILPTLNSHGKVPFPDGIRVYCDHQHCEGICLHELKGDSIFVPGRLTDAYSFAEYVCKNCNVNRKLFALKVEWKKDPGGPGVATKIYQEPPFGNPIPKRLFEIIGEANREFFLQARRAIARGLGIGAYGYYRRIVENTKLHLVLSVLEVAKATNAPSAQVQLLERAQKETQFSKAIELLRDVGAVPPVLLIRGHNPLALLHDLFSEGIHKFSDTECLDRARDGEVILCELASRMQLASEEQKAVSQALTNIMKRRDAGAEDVNETSL